MTYIRSYRVRGHVLAFDNLSGLPAWISDTLCRLATGGGFAVRQLYSDQDEVLFDAMRQVILNVNAFPGFNTVRFAIPGAGVHVIRPVSPLPEITEIAAVDASTQPGFTGTPLVQVDGSDTLADVYRYLTSLTAGPGSGRGLANTLTALKASTVSRPPALTAAHPEPTPPAARRPAALSERLEQFGYIKTVLWLGEQLADGLAHAHERGIVHRDVKPANVLLTDGGRPMLLDFNMATDARPHALPAGGSIGGTLPYMSPEQLRGGKDYEIRCGKTESARKRALNKIEIFNRAAHDFAEALDLTFSLKINDDSRVAGAPLFQSINELCAFCLGEHQIAGTELSDLAILKCAAEIFGTSLNPALADFDVWRSELLRARRRRSSARTPRRRRWRR